MTDDQIKALGELVRHALAQASETDASGDQPARNAEQVVTLDTAHGKVGAFVTLDPAPCEHDWADDDGMPGHCRRCGMSFMRYAFTEAP
jgi:hypothetical protein